MDCGSEVLHHYMCRTGSDQDMIRVGHKLAAGGTGSLSRRKSQVELSTGQGCSLGSYSSE